VVQLRGGAGGQESAGDRDGRPVGARAGLCRRPGGRKEARRTTRAGQCRPPAAATSYGAVQTARTAAALIEDEEVGVRGDQGRRGCRAIEDLLYV
jgi:hypothetical protein